MAGENPLTNLLCPFHLVVGFMRSYLLSPPAVLLPEVPREGGDQGPRLSRGCEGCQDGGRNREGPQAGEVHFRRVSVRSVPFLHTLSLFLSSYSL